MQEQVSQGAGNQTAEAQLADDQFMRDLALNAIRGIGAPKSFTLTQQLERDGALIFVGNQHSEAWIWNGAWLEAHSTEELQSLYAGLYEKREG